MTHQFSKSWREEQESQKINPELVEEVKRIKAEKGETFTHPATTKKVTSAAVHGVCSIQSTTKYELFKILNTNRPIDRQHVNNLVAAIRRKNLLHLNPIVVDGKMNVIDGQHRLSAAKILKVPIYYTQDDKISEDDIAGMNSNKKNWNLYDYIRFYAHKGKRDYAEFLSICEKYPDIPYTIMLALCASDGKRHGKDVKEGIVDIGNIEKAEILIAQLSDFKRYFDQADSSRFIEAFLFLNTTGLYDHEHMKKKIEANPGALIPCATQKQYIQLLQSIYNKGVHEKNIVLFIKR